MKEQIKERLSQLIERYNMSLRYQPHDNISEETIRVWLNEFLGIFGWDVQNTNQVLQEHVLQGAYRQRLNEIQSTHRRPDYILKNGTNIKSFLDAKSLDVDIFTDGDAAFQIRSYGWSAQSPCAFISNFEQFVICDTRFTPNPSQPANMGAIQLSVDEYIEQFDVLFSHLWRQSVCSNQLEALYSTARIEGRDRLDEQFAEMLSIARLQIANNIVEHNHDRLISNVALNYYVQVIIDRIIFIRVCESKGIEQQGKLKGFTESTSGFWDAFKQSCYMEFYDHYDGAMFERDYLFQELQMDDEPLNEFIKHLYYPFPYRFDVIPVKVIASIYEEFLGKQLEYDGRSVSEVTKDEYIKTNGAVSTPEHIVDMVCKQTINIARLNTMNDIMKTKILDPCCGSGAFMVACYELITTQMVKVLHDSPEEAELYSDYFCTFDDTIVLTIKGRRAAIVNCIHGIDCDEAAIEVAKMSLALKIVDGTNPLIWEPVGAYGNQILRDISCNVKLGNTLVEPSSVFTTAQTQLIKPMKIRTAFPAVFGERDGFDYIVGNPPYVETKHYKAAQPVMHQYLRDHYSAFEGKADLAVLFIERCLALISGTGKVGFIIQRRWFKTEYGAAARKLIDDGRNLYKLIDFKATDIFKGRITYVSILILSKSPCASVKYFYLADTAEQVKNLFENSFDDGAFGGYLISEIPMQLHGGVWSYESHDVIQIKSRLTSAMGLLGNYQHLAVKDGIQALWKKAYHLTDVRFFDNRATGTNGFGEQVTVEAEILRAVIYNRVFYPFKRVVPDAYCIFPYHGASTNVIKPNELHQHYPLLNEYLNAHEALIRQNVRCRDDAWYAFTREHNHHLYMTNKIIIPMTAKDTIATYMPNCGLYMDNANVWFITVEGASDELMKAISCVINSTVFSVMAKAEANPQAGGYYKFNKQFLIPVPFPCEQIREGSDCVRHLSRLYDAIAELQNVFLTAIPEQKTAITYSLEERWNELDNVCEAAYGLTEPETAVINGVGRSISRIELLNGAN